MAATTAVLAVLCGFVAFVFLPFTRQFRATKTRDAVQVIANAVSALISRNRAATQQDIDVELRALHDGSITAVELDAAGKPVDLYGTPFRVRRDIAGPTLTVTAASAGPDRTFDTADDIVHTTTWDLNK